MKQLHSGAKWHYRINGFFSFVFASIFLGFFFGGIFLARNAGAAYPLWNSSEFIFGIVFIFAILLVWVEIFARLSYKFFKYEFKDNQLRIEKGIIWKRYSNIPYQRIQNVDITRGVIARILGFSTVNIHTAGYSGTPQGGKIGAEGYLPAVSIKEAEQIREFVIKKISKNKNSGL